LPGAQVSILIPGKAQKHRRRNITPEKPPIVYSSCSASIASVAPRQNHFLNLKCAEFRRQCGIQIEGEPAFVVMLAVELTCISHKKALDIL
jgi:hypothetical protein